MWPLPILIISLIAVVMYWPFLYESVEKRITSGVQTETERAERKSTQVPANADGSSSFDNMLETALRYDREGNRALAATLFQQLLRQEMENTAYTEHAAALLPRA